jgi:hypothetical protein
MPISLHRWENTAQDRDFRNKTNQNWENIEKVHNHIEEASEKAVKAAHEATEEAKKASDLATTVRKELDVVIQGDSSIEAAHARLDAEGKTHATLKERIDSDFRKNLNKINVYQNEITQKLKDKVIITNNPPTVSQRKEGSIYFHITDSQPIGTVNSVKISPTMGMKIID